MQCKCKFKIIVQIVGKTPNHKHCFESLVARLTTKIRWANVVYDVISGRKVKTVLGYIVVNFEVAINSSFREIPKKIIS